MAGTSESLSGPRTEMVDCAKMHKLALHRTGHFILIVLSSVFAGCDGFVHVRGVVRNPAGKPVAGATIHVTDMTDYWYTQSDENGCFYASGTTAGTHSSEPLTVVASGYKNASTKVRTSIAQRNQVIVILVPYDSPGGSRIQLLTPKDNKDLEACPVPK